MSGLKVPQCWGAYEIVDEFDHAARIIRKNPAGPRSRLAVTTPPIIGHP